MDLKLGNYGRAIKELFGSNETAASKTCKIEEYKYGLHKPCDLQLMLPVDNKVLMPLGTEAYMVDKKEDVIHVKLKFPNGPWPDYETLHFVSDRFGDTGLIKFGFEPIGTTTIDGKCVTIWMERVADEI